MHMPKDFQPDQIVSIYAELGNYERHFNQIQSGYRTIASQWLLAAFGAIGYLLVQDGTGSFTPETLAAFVSFLASIGLLLLWNLDVNVYHRLLVASFNAGLAFEQNHGLPNIRSNMNLAKKHVSTGLRSFYLLAVIVMLAIAFYLSFYSSIMLLGIFPLIGICCMLKKTTEANSTNHD